ncbi:MAG: 1-acyl-sn-glycerol-3-phosphate acyltransferase [Pseudomonadota bacterium]
MNLFDDIRPYHDDEVRPTIERLLNDREFLKVIARFRFPKAPEWSLSVIASLLKRYLSKQSQPIRSVHDLQLIVVEGYVRRMLDESTSGLTVSGEDNLDKHKSHLFISNHRDIVVDPALVNWALYHRGHHTLHIAIGDNLLTKPYVSDLMRLNKSFIVNRSATRPREKLQAAKHLSSYIHYALIEEQANIWIAQREGRAKDGIDRTNSAVIRMLSLSKPKSVSLTDYIHELNIVPVSISYEHDPCDIVKAKELYQQKVHGKYEKQAHEDAHSIAKGITGSKGRVHVAFGEPLCARYAATDDIVAELDQKIIDNYVLQASNCVAYQELHGTLPAGIVVTDRQVPFSARDFANEIHSFKQHLADCDASYREFLLSMYANPIVSQYPQMSKA